MPPLFIEVPVPWQESEQSCICVLGVSILPLSTMFLLDCGTVLTMWYPPHCITLSVVPRTEYTSV
jgi:hypothetical protein